MICYDNFLTFEQSSKIKETLESNYFPWYFQDAITYINGENVLDDYQFIHTFYQQHSSTSNYFFLLEPFIRKINPAAIIRIKANLNAYTGIKKVTEFHVDYDNIKSKTALYYVNTNNGKTLFENGESVECVQNRLVIFDSNISHAAEFATNIKNRCVINFNYVEWNNND